jgi:gas vesicle protein
MEKERTILGLLIGFGIGVGLTLLFAPQSGEDTRDWIALTSRRAKRGLRNTGRRSMDQVRDLIDRGQETINKAIRQRTNGPESEVTEL